MEVHHHRHPEHSGARKKWTHYFWEFFMLFLAVFCGFLAENQREHYVEHRREKQYIKSFIEDLKQDTLQLGEIIRLMIDKQEGIDSLVVVLKKPDVFEHTKELYRLTEFLFDNAAFVANDRTMQQMKNAGGLRLIRNQKVSDSISVYDQELRFLSMGENDRFSRLSKTFDSYEEIFDLGKISFINYLNKKLPPPLSFKLFTNNQEKMELFANSVLMQTVNELTYIQNLKRIKNYAARIIPFLKKEYHIN